MASVTDHVRAALAGKYDPKADYVVVRPAMVGTPKFAGYTVVGEFTEDTRNETKMVVLVRPVPPPAPPAVRAAKPLPVPAAAVQRPAPSKRKLW